MEEEVKIEGNLDINQALKEFEMKSEAEQIQKTAVEEKVPDVPKMVQLVMKWSGVKEQKQAEYILLGFVVVAIIVSLFLVLGGGVSARKKPSATVLEQIKLMPSINSTN